MPRQIFTFLAVFILIFFVMRSCAPKPTAPPALADEQIQAAPTDVIVLGKAGGPVVTLARDGSIVSIVVGEAQVLQPVNAWRRTLRTFLRFPGDQKLSIPAEKWAEPERDGDSAATFSFVHDDGTSIRKTLTLDKDGLRVAIVALDDASA